MKKVLGKGLSALIPDSYLKEGAEKDASISKAVEKFVSGQNETVQKISEPTNLRAEEKKAEGFELISMSKILANHEQPRKDFSPQGIEDLANSIKQKGILQPVVVKAMDDGKYQVVCGERRLRAAFLCGLTEIPAVIKDVADEEFLEWALIENIQREDLNALEEAEAYQKLIEERMYSQEELAKRIGKTRPTVTNTMRLLRLPEQIKNYIINGELSAGHARALLGLLSPEHQRQMAKRIVEENLSVRQVEAIVGRSNAHKRKAKTARHLSPEIIDLEERMAQFWGTQVKIHPRKNQKEGRIEIQYFSLDDLDRILQKTGIPKERQ